MLISSTLFEGAIFFYLPRVALIGQCPQINIRLFEVLREAAFANSILGINW